MLETTLGTSVLPIARGVLIRNEISGSQHSPLSEHFWVVA